MIHRATREKRPTSAILIWVLFVLTMAISGCHRYAAPVGMPTHPAVGMTALANGMSEQSHVVARAEIEVSHLLGTEKVNANIVMRPPGDLRLELLSPTDDLLAIFVSNEHETRLFQRGAGECIVQVGCQGNLQGLLPVPIHVNDLVSILLGGGPRALISKQPMEWNDAKGTLVLLEDDKSSGVRRVHLDPCSFKVVGVEWWKKQVLSVRAGVLEGDTVQFHVPDEGVDVKMTFIIRDTEMSVEDDAFSFPCPGGVKEHVYRCVHEESSP